MKILVTGGNGFLGRYLIEALPKGYIFAPSRLRYDLEIEEDVVSLLDSFEPDIIFHLAGNPNINQACGLTKQNILPTHHLLEHCKEGTRFVLASSAAVYGDRAADWADEVTPSSPNSVYGATKVASEALVNAYHEQGRVHGLVLRYVANVGKGATHGLVKDIVAKLLSTSPTLDLLGDSPGSTKHYIHASDTAAATAMFGLNTSICGTINIANEDVLTVEEVAQVAMSATNIFKPIRWLGEQANWKGDNRVVKVDAGVARRLGWKPKFAGATEAIFHAVYETIKEPTR